jgi:hypothetical protein
MKKIIQLLDTFRDAQTIFLHNEMNRLAEFSDEKLVAHYNQTFENALSTSENSLEAFRAQGYEFTRRFGLSPVAYPEEKVLQASGPIQSAEKGWSYLVADDPNTPPVIDRSPLIDERPIREVAPPGFNHRLYWTIRLNRDPEFANIRFKRLEKGYPPSVQFPTESIDIVDYDVFYDNEPDRLPFFVGSQFGLQPFKAEHSKYLEGKYDTVRVAVLGRSALSGHVAGLSIYEIQWIHDEPKSAYRVWKKIREIRKYPNE